MSQGHPSVPAAFPDAGARSGCPGWPQATAPLARRAASWTAASTTASSPRPGRRCLLSRNSPPSTRAFSPPLTRDAAHHRPDARAECRDGAAPHPPLQRRRTCRAGGQAALGAPGDLPGRRARRRDRRRAHRSADPPAAVRLLDPGSAGGLPAGAQGHRHAPQPHRRDPAPRGPALAAPGDLVRRAGRSRLRRKKGRIETLYTAPPEGSVVVCLDEMGPLSAKSYPGRAPGSTRTRPRQGEPSRRSTTAGAARATSSAPSARQRGLPSGDPTAGRGTANWVDFLEEVEGWLPGEIERVYAMVDNLGSHRATDVLLFLLAHPRWEFVFQPKYAAYLNLIEPWWKILRSLALRGAALRAGTRSPRRSRRPPPTGTPTAIPSSGAGGGATPAPPARHRPPAQSRMTCRMNH